MLIHLKRGAGKTEYGETIEITINAENPKKIKVDSMEQISILDKYSYSTKYSIIYNGMILNPSLSFAFYGIRNGDNIYIVKRKEKAIRKKDDSTSYLSEYHLRELIRQVNSANYPEQESLHHEAVRLVDLSFNKLMYRPTSYRRMCTILNKTLANLPPGIDDADSTVLPEKAETPSTAFLPLTQANTNTQTD